MIASRWPLSDVRVIDELPKPERGLVATVHHPAGPLTVASWGAPNAAGEGREAKMDAYLHMTKLLPTLAEPTIVGVDTNSWYDPTPDSERPDDPGWEAEHDFLDRNPPHGLDDVYRRLVDADQARSRLLADLRPHGPLATTFIRRPHRRPRQLAGSIEQGLRFGMDRMDRIFTSRDMTPLACEVLYHEAIDAGGDHAAVVADLELPAI